MKTFNISLLVMLLLISSCSSTKSLEARAKHQSETGSRLNESQRNTDSLFKELE